jgi:hypothetical protein
MSARELARQILGSGASTAEVTNLAICFHRGNGVYRVEPGYRLSRAVLYSPLLVGTGQQPRYPVLTDVSIGTATQGRHIFTTEDVADLFVNQFCRNVGTARPAGYRRTWVPAAKHSLARQPLGGVIDEATTPTTPDPVEADNEYRWYDIAPLERYPLGWVIYRITSSNLLVGFTRVSERHWVRFDTQNPTGISHTRRRIRELGLTGWKPDAELAAISLPAVLTLS